MPHAPFTVMDASAGSGKTYSLVREVLVRALGQPDVKQRLKPVLALTFTNKAAAEMKGRLLNVLIDFSTEDSKDQALLHSLATELGMEPTAVKNRAKQTLKHILHHYNELSFGTLDSFTSRLVRTFAKDMALSENFEIMLDHDPLLTEATDTVMSRAGVDDELTRILLRFVEQKLEDEHSPNIDAALYGTAKKLLEERHREPLAHLSDYSSEQLLHIRKALISKSKSRTAHLVALGQQATAILEDNHLEAQHFYYAGKGIYRYFFSAAEGDMAYTAAPNTYVLAALEQGKWHGTKLNPAQKQTLDAVQADLEDIALQIRQYAAQQVGYILLSDRVCQNMYALATLNALNQSLTALMDARNTLPLAVFNHLVHQQLINEPSLYIFERLGDRYQHYFLDEFQDTSLLQWENLKPLVINSLAASGTALVVGDAKQSIYRWRNGEAEQFINLSEQAEKGLFERPAAAHLHRLADNWRSLKTVVLFNNALFTHAASLLNNPSYANLYTHASQYAKKGEGGFVEVHLHPKDDFLVWSLAQTKEHINQLVGEGYAYRDIALLVRTKTVGAELVQYLTTENIPVISGDSLLLGSSYEGQLLAGLTALRTQPNNKPLRWQLAHALIYGSFIAPAEGAFRFAEKIIHQPSKEVLAILEEYFAGITEVFTAPDELFGFSRKLAAVVRLHGCNNAFADAYLQAIQHFVEVESGNAFDFVRWWQEVGSQKSISAAENVDAVQVLTIHKSKGLQYPVVLVPAVTWKFTENSREAWIALDPNEFEGLEEMIVSLEKKSAAQIGGAYEEMFERLVAQEKFDNLNLLYVACTRAIERLYLFGLEKPAENEIGTVLNTFLATQQNTQADDLLYRWGNPQAPKESTTPPTTQSPEKLVAGQYSGKLRLARNAPPAWQTTTRDARTWGKRVHWLLAKITDVHSVQPLLLQLSEAGTLPDDERAEVAQILENILHHPQLIECFTPGNTVFNERDVLLPCGLRKRPDRIVQTPDGRVCLLDYKTGDPESAHQNQLAEYRALLNQAGFAVAFAAIVYVNATLTVVPVA